MRLLYVISFIICIFLIFLIFNSRNWKNQPVVKIPKPSGEMQTKYILIVSTWRSGSTFFGELLTQYPGTYYSYEPLQYLSHRVNH